MSNSFIVCFFRIFSLDENQILLYQNFLSRDTLIFFEGENFIRNIAFNLY
ncbi:hypothetical protein BH10ACI3_BH10ACI3_09450 [soil metagenome]